MQNTNMTVGTIALAMVGRNEVKVEVVEVREDGLRVKSLSSGKVFSPRRLRAIEPEPQAEQPTEAVPSATPQKKLSLMKAAALVLKETGTAMNVKEMVAKAQSSGLWQPMAGKTPENTLYAAILREIATHENPLFKRSKLRKGAFESNYNA